MALLSIRVLASLPRLLRPGRVQTAAYAVVIFRCAIDSRTYGTTLPNWEISYQPTIYSAEAWSE
jgi:hypothetical protein